MPKTLQIKRGQTWLYKDSRVDCEILALGICADNGQNNQVSVIYTSQGQIYTRCMTEFLQNMDRQE